MNLDLEGLVKSRFDLLESSSRDVLDKAHRFDIAELMRSLSLYPYYCVIDRNEGSTALIENKPVIMLGSNNYLSLTVHPQVRRAAAGAIGDLGTSMTGSRLLNGTGAYHLALEERLARFVGKEAALVATTGYQTNVGTISAILNKHSVAVLDRYCHASLVDGCRVARARVMYFAHNDPSDLDRTLAQIPKDVGVLVVVDGVYSMEGDIADLPTIVEVVRKHGVRLLLDDAHGIGVMGPGGRGTAAHFGLQDEVDLIMGTFSKSLASTGGFIAADAKTIDFIKHFGRAVLFSASAPPPAVAAAYQALEILEREPWRVERLRRNADLWRALLRQEGLNIGNTCTPICPIIVGKEITTLALWRAALDAGVFLNPVLYPAVPKDKAILRTSVTAEHTAEQLSEAAAILGDLGRQFGIATATATAHAHEANAVSARNR